MYGYIRPEKGELKVREYEQFRAVYCGLCEALKRRCGFLARFVVNYDLTFMAMLLSDSDGCLRRRRCPAHPFRKRVCLCGAGSLDAAADYSVILAWWKLRDDVQDKSFIKGVVYRLTSRLLRPAYRKAAKARPAFDINTRDCLRELAALEEENSSSIDQTADCFARILVQAACETAGPRQRVLREVLYHVGRSVYILDAVDDLPKDMQRSQYNPLRYRFEPADGMLTPAEKDELRQTLNVSQHCLASAFHLMEPNPWTAILENIIFIGLPWVTDQVFAGQWQSRKRGKEIILPAARDEKT